ncbi:hypothetical protein RUND412_010622 [Rhizina undulata]
MLRFSAIIPILLSAVGFILSVLCLLAGYNTSFFPNIYVLRVNTTLIGQNVTSISTTGITALDSLTSSVNASTIGEVVSTAAARLGLHDTYTAHVMTYCDGDIVTAANNGTKEQVSNCSSPKAVFGFNPVTILEDELLDGVTLSSLGVSTTQLDTGVAAFETAYKAMSLCYVLGVAMSGLAIAFGFLGCCGGRGTAFCNSIVAFFAFAFIGIASGIATAIAVKVKDILNQYLSDLGVTSTNSMTFLGLTWGATMTLFIVNLYWCGACCCCGGSTRTRHYGEEAAMVGIMEKPMMGRRRWR